MRLAEWKNCACYPQSISHPAIAHRPLCFLTPDIICKEV